MLAAGCPLMLNGSVKAMCSNGRSGSFSGLAHSAGKRDTGLTGESTKSKRAQAATAASRSAPIWLKPV
jgi:hypothetical protein